MFSGEVIAASEPASSGTFGRVENPYNHTSGTLINRECVCTVLGFHVQYVHEHD
jgi:hypothetical protein